MKEFHFYTDGASRGNPGDGSHAAVLVHDKGTVELTIVAVRKYRNVTNNQMELMAILSVLQFIKTNAIYPETNKYIIHSDSKYAINALSQWLPGWKAKGWKTSSGTAVKNKSLLERMDKLYNKEFIQFKHVKGHAGDKYNEIVDTFCNDILDSKTVEFHSM